MRRLAVLFTFLIIYCAPVAIAQTNEPLVIYEEYTEFDDFIEDLNNRKTYPELAEELRQIFIEIDKALSKINSANISLELQDLNTEKFNNLSLSEQLKVFKQNYNALTSFTSSSMEIISQNAKEFANFCNLQSKLFVKFNELLEEGSRIQQSQDDDLALALDEIKKAQETASAMKAQLGTCIMLARIQAEELEKSQKKIKILKNTSFVLLGAGVLTTAISAFAMPKDAPAYPILMSAGIAAGIVGAGGLGIVFVF